MFFRHINIVCECGMSLPLKIGEEFSKIPFESYWSCTCGKVIHIKWNGKELEYI